MTAITYRAADVDGFKIFYREAGAAGRAEAAAAARLPERGPHVPRPDPAAGRSLPYRSRPTCRASATPTCRAAARTLRPTSPTSIDRFTEVVGFDRFALYVFDYGAPTGFRLAVRHPERITAIISQNGNAYEEGLSDGWNPIRAYWQDAVAGQSRGACAPSSRPRRPSGSTPTACPTRRRCRRTATRSTTSIWPARRRRGAARPVRRLQEQRRALPGLPELLPHPQAAACWRCGARTIRSSCRRAPRRSSATSPTRWCASSTPATSRWKPMPRRSRRPSATSCRD